MSQQVSLSEHLLPFHKSLLKYQEMVKRLVHRTKEREAQSRELVLEVLACFQLTSILLYLYVELLLEHVEFFHANSLS